MKRRKVDSQLERQILIAMIVSKPFLSIITPQMDLKLLQSSISKKICGWCIEHFKQYADAPGKSLQAIFSAWVENEKPEEESEVESIQDFLESISSEFDESPTINVQHLLNEASNYLTMRRVGVLKDELEAAMMRGDKEEALQSIQEFRTVRAGDSIGYDPLGSKQIVEDIFAEKLKPIIKFSGDTGKFLNAALVNDSLIGVQGRDKIGKTFVLFEFMEAALRCGRKVAFFQCGDLSKNQFNLRLMVRLAETPMWKSQCNGVLYPTGIRIEQINNQSAAVADRVERTFKRPIDMRLALDAQNNFRRTHKIDKANPHLMFSVHPNSTMNVAGIDAILQRWDYELNFKPDVILIDYADILAPEHSKLDRYEKTNETWKALRRLSQTRFACVITPTQSNAGAYKTNKQGMVNFSEDKRKYAHVTGMLSLNQNDDEKKNGIMRMNWIVLRESEFHADKTLWIAQCIPIGKAMVQTILD